MNPFHTEKPSSYVDDSDEISPRVSGSVSQLRCDDGAMGFHGLKHQELVDLLLAELLAH